MYERFSAACILKVRNFEINNSRKSKNLMEDRRCCWGDLYASFSEYEFGNRDILLFDRFPLWDEESGHGII